MRLSKYEQQLFEEKRKQAMALRAVAGAKSIKRQIREYPCRVVNVATAEQRIRYKNMSLHDACVLPIGTFKQGW
nr:hypothetical protein [uncultured Halomonas sp.]